MHLDTTLTLASLVVARPQAGPATDLSQGTPSGAPRGDQYIVGHLRHSQCYQNAAFYRTCPV